MKATPTQVIQLTGIQWATSTCHWVISIADLEITDTTTRRVYKQFIYKRLKNTFFQFLPFQIQWTDFNSGTGLNIAEVHTSDLDLEFADTEQLSSCIKYSNVADSVSMVLISGRFSGLVLRYPTVSHLIERNSSQAYHPLA